MATVIKLKRGTSAPTTSDIVSGEVAIDTSAQKFYINDGGSVKEIGGVPSGVTLTNPIVSGSLIFEGATADSFETTLQVTDPTGDRTITFQNGSGTVAFLTDVTGGSSPGNFTTISLDNNIIFEGDVANSFETTLAVAEPTADRTVTIPNATGQIVLRDTTDTLSNKTISTLTATGASHTVTDTTSGSSAGPVIELKRDITGADSNYIGQIKFAADNDADQSVNFAKITGKIGDASDGTEDGIIEIAHVKAGSQNINVRMTSTEFKIMNGTDFDIETHDGSSNGLRLANTLVTATAAELNYVDGVTSNIQTQLDAKATNAFAIAQAVALG